MESEPSTSHETNNSETVKITRICKRYCCIPQCENNNIKNPEMSFHKLPKNPEMRKKWIRLLKRKPWSQSPSMLIGFCGRCKNI